MINYTQQSCHIATFGRIMRIIIKQKYFTVGAKFEIHLAQNESLAFTVKGDVGAQLQIGAHRINGSGEGTLSVRCGDTTTGISLHSATLMHYDTGVTLDGSEQTITITNTSGEVIALTDFAYRTGTVEKIECNDKTVASAKQMLLAPDATENPEDNLRIKQATIVLSKDISILFYVADETLEGWENPYMEFTKAKYDAAGAVIGYETQTVTEYIARDGYHIYAFRGINAADLYGVHLHHSAFFQIDNGLWIHDVSAGTATAAIVFFTIMHAGVFSNIKCMHAIVL